MGTIQHKPVARSCGITGVFYQIVGGKETGGILSNSSQIGINFTEDFEAYFTEPSWLDVFTEDFEAYFTEPSWLDVFTEDFESW